MTAAFCAYEIHPLRWQGERCVNCEEEDAEFFSLFGVLLTANGREELICIGDFSSRDAAQIVLDLILPD
jgi:hypothetical protein